MYIYTVFIICIDYWVSSWIYSWYLATSYHSQLPHYNPFTRSCYILRLYIYSYSCDSKHPTPTLTWIYSQIHVILFSLYNHYTYISLLLLLTTGTSKMMPVFPPKKHMPNGIDSPGFSPSQSPKDSAFEEAWSLQNLGGDHQSHGKIYDPNLLVLRYGFLWVYSEPPKKPVFEKKKSPSFDVMNPSDHFALEICWRTKNPNIETQFQNHHQIWPTKTYHVQ